MVEGDDISFPPSQKLSQTSQKPWKIVIRIDGCGFRQFRRGEGLLRGHEDLDHWPRLQELLLLWTSKDPFEEVEVEGIESAR